MGRWRLGPAWGARTSNGSRPCTYSAARRISAAAASSRFSDAFARASAIFASETTRCAMPLALSESCRSMLCSETVAARDRVGTAAASSAARSWRPVSSSAESCTGITLNGTFIALISAKIASRSGYLWLTAPVKPTANGCAASPKVPAWAP